MVTADSQYSVTPVVEGEPLRARDAVDAGTVRIHGSGADTPSETAERIGLGGDRAATAVRRLTRTKRVETK